MEYFNEKNNQLNYNNDQILFETDESESEFDAFEHHLSQYENRDDEELVIEDNKSILIDHNDINLENLESDQIDGSQHQISLATSFCKNTQDQNDDFLDDKFNGDLLLENFSEDKFIKCKYSEDFYCDQLTSSHPANKHQLTNESEVDNEHTEHDKLQQIEERSSEDERVIERRRKHFLEFILTLPKVCTPSVCGTMSQKQNSDFLEFETNNPHLGRLTESNEESLFDYEEEEDELNSNYEKNKFDWSIDQLATLKPVDISFNERRFLRFKDFEADQLTQEKLTKENELFFSQETIAPSPTKQDLRLNFKNLKQEFSFNQESNNLTNDGGKDSGNYSADDETENNVKKNLEFESSFTKQSNELSSFNFDSEFNKLETYPKESKTPLRNQNSFMATNLDFKPNFLLQTSTPCAFKLNELNDANKKPIEKNLEEDNLINQINQSIINYDQKANCNKKIDPQRLPFQERNSIKQKKKLFHDFSTSSSNLSSFNQINSSSFNQSSSISTNCSSRSNNYDEGIYEISKEVTFGLSNESLMSICDNNSLTPRPKKQRNSIVKSFAERLNEIELYADNDENNSNRSNSNIKINLADSKSTMTEYSSEEDFYPNSNSASKCMHNLTDSNCLVIKNFNNLFNNSDSGCCVSNRSTLNSGLDTKGRILFN